LEEAFGLPLAGVGCDGVECYLPKRIEIGGVTCGRVGPGRGGGAG
jgi:hypothetical protein